MALQVVRTGSAEYGRWIKALICGEPGSGKTLFSSTFPNAIFASVEGGLMSIASRNIPFVDIEDTTQLEELKIHLNLPPAEREKYLGVKVDTVVLDTIDEIQGLFIKERLNDQKQDVMKIQDWGWLKDELTALLRGFRNLDMHVVFTCHVKSVQEDEGIVRYRPGLQGAISDWVPGAVDLSLLLTNRIKTQIVDNEAKPVVTRWLQTYPDQQHQWIKDRSGKLPHEFPINFNDDFARINELIFGDIDALAPSSPTEPEIRAEEAPTEEPVVVESPQEVVEPPKPVEVQHSAALGFTCEGCGDVFDQQAQADLSRIRLRKVLCQPCYKEAQASKNTRS